MQGYLSLSQKYSLPQPSFTDLCALQELSFDLQPLYCKWDFERTMVYSGASARCWKKQLFKIIFSVIFVVFWK